MDIQHNVAWCKRLTARWLVGMQNAPDVIGRRESSGLTSHRARR
jgi:hypothetical protein